MVLYYIEINCQNQEENMMRCIVLYRNRGLMRGKGTLSEAGKNSGKEGEERDRRKVGTQMGKGLYF